MKTYGYDPQEINTNVGGKDVSGYAKGTFVKAARNVDQAALVVGSDGDNTVVHSANRSGRVTITLQQASPLNDYFTALANAFEAKTGGVVPVLSKDGNGTTKINAAKAWIVKRADTSFADEAENREWVFETGNLVLDIGGAVEL